MMHGRGKSDFAIVAVKPANKAEYPAEQSAVEATAAEPVERRAETKGNASQQSTHRTQSWVSVSQALERIRQAFAVVTRGKSRMRESCMYGSARGALSNGRPYRDRREFIALLGGVAAHGTHANRRHFSEQKQAVVASIAPVVASFAHSPSHYIGPFYNPFLSGDRAPAVGLFVACDPHGNLFRQHHRGLDLARKRACGRLFPAAATVQLLYCRWSAPCGIGLYHVAGRDSEQGGGRPGQRGHRVQRREFITRSAARRPRGRWRRTGRTIACGASAAGRFVTHKEIPLARMKRAARWYAGDRPHQARNLEVGESHS
jgi:hypothetical protein